MSILIIAEAGVNHNGDLETGIKLIDVAKKAGADIVKFQTFKAEKLVTKKAIKAQYQKANTGNEETQFEMLKRLEINHEMHLAFVNHCKKINIQFLSTPFDIESVDYLLGLGINTIKIPSGEITNLPYLRHIARKKKKIILSSGMSTLKEIEDALKIFDKEGFSREKITILHCNTQYPTPMQDVNLKAMSTIKKFLHVKVGYSDHTMGIEIPIAAAALGATVIEKHFTLDRSLPGPDHLASLEPTELIQMVKCIRNIEKAMGDGEKKPSLSEIPNITIARKSIVAAQKIKKGELFTEHNLKVTRPGNGISPMQWDSILGKPASRDFTEDSLVTI